MKKILTFILCILSVVSSTQLNAEQKNIIYYPNEVFINDAGEIFESNDYGKTWFKVLSDITNNTQSTEIIDYQYQDFISSDGKTYTSSDYGKTWTLMNDSKCENTLNNNIENPLLIFPNPVFDKQIVVSFFSLELNNASIMILNNNNEILLHKHTNIFLGNNDIIIPLTEIFVPGTYYVLLKTNNKEYRNSFILMF